MFITELKNLSSIHITHTVAKTREQSVDSR